MVDSVTYSKRRGDLYERVVLRYPLAVTRVQRMFVFCSTVFTYWVSRVNLDKSISVVLRRERKGGWGMLARNRRLLSISVLLFIITFALTDLIITFIKYLALDSIMLGGRENPCTT